MGTVAVRTGATGKLLTITERSAMKGCKLRKVDIGWQGGNPMKMQAYDKVGTNSLTDTKISLSPGR